MELPHFEMTFSNFRYAVFGNATLERGHTGQAVKNLQTYLTHLGYSTAGADGVFGSNTESAVKRYQRAKGIDDDGYAGAITQRKIKDDLDI